MAYNTQEERFVVKGSERITRDLQVNGTVYTNGLVVDSPIENLNVANLAVENVTLSNDLIVNGTTGNNGQVLGKVDGKVEWFSPASIDTNDFKVNYLTVNNAANIADANVTNLVAENFQTNVGSANDFNVTNIVAENVNTNELNTVNFAFDDLNGNNGYIDTLAVNNLTANTFITNQVVDDLVVNNLTVNVSANINGNNFVHKGFDVTSMTVISEDDYNNLYGDYRNQAFYMTTPNGNLYFHGVMYSPSNPVVKNYIAFVDLPNMANHMQTLTTSTLTFTSDAVTNSFINRGAYNGIKELTPFSDGWNNSAPIGTQANTGSIITNASELYIISASHMYASCNNLTDTFITNPSLIIGAPANYNPLKYCTSMYSTFYKCTNFNQPVTIPSGVTSMYLTFSSCNNFNQPVIIPSSVTNMRQAFAGCTNLNQPITISSGVIDMGLAFAGCNNFNQPVIIPNTVTNIHRTFYNCYSFNQPVTIGNNVDNMAETFSDCNVFNQSVTIPDSVTTLSGTFGNCFFLNSPITIGNNVTNMVGTFRNCGRFNQPITIPDSVTDMVQTFSLCKMFNSPITIGNNVINMSYTFMGCDNLNQHIIIPDSVINTSYMFKTSWFNSPVTIGNNVIDMTQMFNWCDYFNQPIIIPENVESAVDSFMGCRNFNSPVTILSKKNIMLSSMFSDCRNLNAPITIPENAIYLDSMFAGCTKLDTSTVPIHISHNIALGDTTNYIYNCLVNGYTGIAFDPSRILNDA